MRLMAITLTFLTAAIVAAITKADDVPKHSPELQVLDHFVGAWDIKVSVKPKDQPADNLDATSFRKWSRSGKYVTFDDPDLDGLHMTLTYDPKLKTYPGTIIAGLTRGFVTGTWDKDTNTMNVVIELTDKNTYRGTHRFIREDYAEVSGMITNPDGDVLVELSYKQTRRKETGNADAKGVAGLAANDPLEPLNRRIGTWVVKNYQKKAEWTPEARTHTGVETIKWVLDKKFIQGDVIFPDGVKKLWLINYDAEAKVYRLWYFDNQNGFSRGETVGHWDAKAERMDWKTNLGNGVLGKMIFKYADKDTFEWSLIAHDANGKLMFDAGGTLTRKK